LILSAFPFISRLYGTEYSFSIPPYSLPNYLIFIFFSPINNNILCIRFGFQGENPYFSWKFIHKSNKIFFIIYGRVHRSRNIRMNNSNFSLALGGSPLCAILFIFEILQYIHNGLLILCISKYLFRNAQSSISYFFAYIISSIYW